VTEELDTTKIVAVQTALGPLYTNDYKMNLTDMLRNFIGGPAGHTYDLLQFLKLVNKEDDCFLSKYMRAAAYAIIIPHYIHSYYSISQAADLFIPDGCDYERFTQIMEKEINSKRVIYQHYPDPFAIIRLFPLRMTGSLPIRFTFGNDLIYKDRVYLTDIVQPDYQNGSLIVVLGDPYVIRSPPDDEDTAPESVDWDLDPIQQPRPNVIWAEVQDFAANLAHYFKKASRFSEDKCNKWPGGDMAHPMAQTNELVVDTDQKNIKRVMERRVCSEQSPFSGTWKWIMCYGRNQLGDANFDTDPRYQRALPPQTPDPARAIADKAMIDECATFMTERDCENTLVPETRYCMWGVLDSKLQCLVRCASMLNKDVCTNQKRCNWNRDTFSGQEVCQAQPAYTDVDTDPEQCRGGVAPNTYYTIQQYLYFFYDGRCYPSLQPYPSTYVITVQTCPVATLPYLVFNNKCYGWAPHDPTAKCDPGSPYAWDSEWNQCLAYPPIREDKCIEPYVLVNGKCLYNNKMLSGKDYVDLCVNQGYLSQVANSQYTCEKQCTMLSIAECPTTLGADGKPRCKLDKFFNDNQVCIPI